MSNTRLVSPSANATTGIAPMRFVILDSSNQYTVLQASSATASPLFGISQPGTRYAPWVGLDNSNPGVAGLPGENLGIWDDPSDKDVMVESGGTINPGDLLTTDSSGRAVATTTDGNFIGAQANGAATGAGQFIPVNILKYQHA